MTLPSLILASASPRRVELLRQLEVDFDVLPSQAAEVLHEQMTAGELSQLNAYRKARVVSKKHPDAVVLGVDTVVALGAKCFGKPATRDEARLMLSELQGQTHYVVTGVCLTHLRAHHQRMYAEVTRVTFRSLTRDDIEHYLAKINPLDKAGAYAIQEHGDDIVRSISGSFSNVVGLPVESLREALAEFGYHLAEVAR